MSAIGSISQDGNLIAFTSDWLGNLGSEKGPTTTCNSIAASTLKNPLLITTNWAANHTYSSTAVISPTVGNAGQYEFQATGAGKSGATQPAAWPQTRGTTVTDGTVTWANVGINCRSDVFVVKLR